MGAFSSVSTWLLFRVSLPRLNVWLLEDFGGSLKGFCIHFLQVSPYRKSVSFGGKDPLSLSPLSLSLSLTKSGSLRLKWDGTHAVTRFRLSAKRWVHLNRRGRQFSRLLAAEVCASAVVMPDTPCCEVVSEYWLPNPFASFPFTSPPMRHRVPSHFNWTLQRIHILKGDTRHVKQNGCLYVTEVSCGIYEPP